MQIRLSIHAMAMQIFRICHYVNLTTRCTRFIIFRKIMYFSENSLKTKPDVIQITFRYRFVL